MNWTEFTTDTKPHLTNEDRYVSSQDILETLNIAVWAPNDGQCNTPLNKYEPHLRKL